MRYDFGEVITAMVTPFDKNGKVDYNKVEELTSHLMNNGSDSVIVTGTTGESPTLIYDEEIEILNSALRASHNSKKVIMGTGSNCTETAVMMSKRAEKEGASGILSVVPYYNKPSQKGIIAHFSAVAESVKLPIILYNIPSRTGINMTVETAKYLTEKYDNIVAIKQSFGDLDTIGESFNITGDTVVSFNQIMSILASELNTKAPDLLHIPYKDCLELNQFLPKDLMKQRMQNAIFDTSKIKSVAGEITSKNERDIVKIAIQWLNEDKKRIRINEELNSKLSDLTNKYRTVL